MAHLPCCVAQICTDRLDPLALAIPLGIDRRGTHGFLTAGHAIDDARRSCPFLVLTYVGWPIRVELDPRNMLRDDENDLALLKTGIDPHLDHLPRVLTDFPVDDARARAQWTCSFQHVRDGALLTTEVAELRAPTRCSRSGEPVYLEADARLEVGASGAPMLATCGKLTGIVGIAIESGDSVLAVSSESILRFLMRRDWTVARGRVFASSARRIA